MLVYLRRLIYVMEWHDISSVLHSAHDTYRENRFVNVTVLINTQVFELCTPSLELFKCSLQAPLLGATPSQMKPLPRCPTLCR